MQDPQINLLMVLIAALLNNIIGALWYSPLLFGEAWRRALGKTKEDFQVMQKDSMRAMGLNAIAILFLTYVFAHFILAVNAETALGGATAGFWVWIGFVATTGFANVVFENRSKKVYLIYQAYQCVALVVTGALLAVWQ